MDFGCFVELEGVRGQVREGLVHVGQIQQVRPTLPPSLPPSLPPPMKDVIVVLTRPSLHPSLPPSLLSSQQGMLRDPKVAVRRGQRVKVKVISITGSKLSLSMKEVEQTTGTPFPPSLPPSLPPLNE